MPTVAELLERNANLNSKAKQELEVINNWYNVQNKVSSSSKLLAPLQEVFVKEYNFINDMKRLDNALDVMLDKVSTPKNRQVISQYKQKINTVLTLHKELDLLSILSDPQKSSSEIISSLETHYKSSTFKKFIQSLIDLEHTRQDVEEFFQRKKDKFTKIEQAKINGQVTTYNKIDIALARENQAAQTFNAFTLMPAQRILRFAMPLEAAERIVNENMQSSPSYARDKQALSSTIELLKKESDAFNSQKGEQITHQLVDNTYNSGPKDDKEIKKFMLDKLLSYYFYNASDYPDDEHGKQHRVDALLVRSNINAYLIPLLLRTYSNYFFYNTKTSSIDIKPKDHNYGDIHAAFGIDLMKPGASLSINLEQFNLKALNKLYENTQDPLWLVLMSIRRVSNASTAKENIAALLTLAHAYKNKALTKKEKYKGALRLAQAAFQIADQYPDVLNDVNNGFGVTSEIGQWIVNKHLENKQEIPQIFCIKKVNYPEVNQQESKPVETSIATTIVNSSDHQTENDAQSSSTSMAEYSLTEQSASELSNQQSIDDINDE
ncbi:MAG: hypothetical protein ACOVQX_02090, partial [Legionella sp.]